MGSGNGKEFWFVFNQYPQRQIRVIIEIQNIPLLQMHDFIDGKGDILTLDYDPNLPLKVLVEDKPKFFAIPGTHNGKKAISLTGVYQ